MMIGYICNDSISQFSVPRVTPQASDRRLSHLFLHPTHLVSMTTRHRLAVCVWARRIGVFFIIFLFTVSPSDKHVTSDAADHWQRLLRQQHVSSAALRVGLVAPGLTKTRLA